MGQGMKEWLRKLALMASLAGLGMGCTLAGHAQSGAVRSLLDKAKSQETSGHLDLAAQSWQQVLLADPNNTEAISGLARWARLSGNDKEAEKYLDRMRQINPNDPNIARIQQLASNKSQTALLANAAKLAQQGKNEEALRIYRQIWGSHPPDGDWALAYYDTEASIDTYRADAINALRELARRNPAESRYATALARILTYSPKTRAEGEKMLREYPQDSRAQAALRQALIWDSQNPSSSAAIRDYLKTHPDAELQKELEETQARQDKALAGLVGSPEERAAYQLLQANKIEEAEAKFQAILAKQPSNGRVQAGLGFIRMKQNNFGGAISYFDGAMQNGDKTAIVQSSLSTSRFWFNVQQGTAALNQNELDEAVARYKAALVIRPNSPEALQGLAGVYSREKQPALAAEVYAQIVRAEPGNAAGWRGLFMAQSDSGNAKGALTTAQRFPAAVRTTLQSQPEYLQALANAYSTNGQTAEAQQVLASALNLPFPSGGKGMKADMRLQYASLLAANKRYVPAAALYLGVVNEDPDNVSAWQGLVSVMHQGGQDADAIETAERMPPSTYEQALRDPGFLSMLAAIYQQQNHFDVAQGFLENAAKLETAAGHTPSVPLQLQLASIYLQRNNPQAAYAIYRRVLTEHPDQISGWKGLMAALHQTGHDQEAMAQIRQIPADVRKTLQQDVEYQQTLAAVYAATGNPAAALMQLAQIQRHYAQQHMAPPADVEIQNAWLLYNSKDDRDLYASLMRLGGHTDMSDDQRRMVQTIWASWSVRRAGEAADAGNLHRSLTILNAAAIAFPGNPAVSKSLATGYLKAGQPKAAVAIYKTLDMTSASAADFQGAMGAALAAQDMKQAEVWLREALLQFASDPQVLQLAARFEQARGDNKRAAAYYRASLNAMPAASPANDLANALRTPDQAKQTRRAQPTDLASLLSPEADAEAASQNRASVIPLPGYNSLLPSPSNTAAYGPDPYSSVPPVILDQPAQNSPTFQAANNPLPANNTGNGRGGKTSDAPQQTGLRLGDFIPQANLEAPEVPGTTPDVTQSADVAAPSTSQGNEPYHETAADTNLIVPVDMPSAPPNADPVATATESEMAAEEPAQPLHLVFSSHNLPSAEQVQTDSQIDEQPSIQAVVDQSQLLKFLPPTTDQGALSRAQDTMAPTRRPNQTMPYQYVEYAPPQAYAVQDAQQPPLPPAPPETQPQTQQPQSQQPVYQRPPSDGNSPGIQQVQPLQPGVTDDQLMQQNLPPLRGAYTRPIQPQQQDPRYQAEVELATIEGGYSPWFGGSGWVAHRSGAPGLDKLTTLESPFEASSPMGTTARLTVVTKATFLDAGLVDGTSTDRLGTLPLNTLSGQQNAAGVGGELQLATHNFAASAGYTPFGFLVSNITGRFQLKPAAGPFTISFIRDSVKDTQLSYSGLRDPGSAGPGFDGNIWGGVMSNAGQVQYAKGDASSGYYIGVGGQYITGHHVETNTRFDGSAGAYWRVLSVPDQGSLSLGANFFGMHYAHNLRFFTYGQGGYFSPEAYFLVNMPVTWTGHVGVNLHYNIAGSVGAQAFQEDTAFAFPLDPALQTANNNPIVPARSSVGGNYDFHTQVAYHLTDHWYIGGFVTANNSRDYATQTAGFFIRFLFRPQYPTELMPTGIFPTEGLRPAMVP
jgi:tetratricopeptide (TPR) repeat protein